MGPQRLMLASLIHLISRQYTHKQDIFRVTSKAQI